MEFQPVQMNIYWSNFYRKAAQFQQLAKGSREVASEGPTVLRQARHNRIQCQTIG